MICRIGYDCWATFKSILYRSSRWISSAGCLLHCCLHASQQHRVDCYCFFPSIYLFTGSRQSIDRSATESVVVHWIGNRWSVTDMNSEILPEWDEWWSRLKSSADYHVRTVDWWVSLQVCRYTEWMNGNGLMPDALAVESEKKMQEECFSDTQAQHQEKSSKCRALGRMGMELNWWPCRAAEEVPLNRRCERDSAHPEDSRIAMGFVRSTGNLRRMGRWDWMLLLWIE